MKLSFFFAGISYVIYVLNGVLIYFRKKNIYKKAGSCVLEMKNPVSKLFFAVMVMVPLLISLILYIPMDISMEIIICGCALLAEEIVIREYLISTCGGLYENLLIAGGKLIIFSDIKALPTLAYEDDPDAVTLRIVSEKRGVCVVEFSKSEIRKKVVTYILEIRPDLKP